MKTLLVICAAVLLLQFLTIWKVGSSTDGSQPKAKDVENGDWKPEGNVPPLAEKAEAYLDRYRPRISLTWDERRVGFGASKPVAFENGDADGRVAKFRLIEGSAVRIAYQNPRDGKWQKLCLCTEGGLAGVTPPLDCEEGFRPRDCPTEGQIVVYEEQGKFLLQGLGLTGGSIRQY